MLVQFCFISEICYINIILLIPEFHYSNRSNGILLNYVNKILVETFAIGISLLLTEFHKRRNSITIPQYHHSTVMVTIPQFHYTIIPSPHSNSITLLNCNGILLIYENTAVILMDCQYVNGIPLN